MPLLLLLLAAPTSTQHPDDSLRAALLAAEDSRARSPAALELLQRTAVGKDSEFARIAVRALGRLEHEENLPSIAAALAHADPDVRGEAANAVAQATSRTGAAIGFALLAARLEGEGNDRAARALLAAIGRLRLEDGELDPAQTLLLEHLGSTAPVRRAGAIRGLADLLRRRGPHNQPDARTRQGLQSIARRSPDARERRLGIGALALSGSADSSVLAAALRDEDMEVRRQAAAGLRTTRDLTGRNALIDLAWSDRAFQVRVEALRAFGSHRQRPEGCGPLLGALTDPSTHVVLLATDLLGDGCGAGDSPGPVLDHIAQEPLDATTWHRQAHALVSLARIDSARGTRPLARALSSDVPWVRAYAAVAATSLKDRASLHRLLSDRQDNVREAALRGLATLDGHGADAAAIAQLARADLQLLLTAANLLKDSPEGARTVPVLIDALNRVTGERKETSRDTRLALLERIAEWGSAPNAPSLQRYIADFDPMIAARAAELLSMWTDTAVAPAPALLPQIPLPTPAALRDMRTATIVMAEGGRIVLRLHPDLAPTNVARFVRMVREGWFDGLTLHRVVPNFVLQGGSPGANEYVGAPRFARDEVGGSHLRGTVGISTRGRDTGDGQLFFNLVDNLRLDHDYTVIGEVVVGLDVIDRVLEGAVMARITIP